MTVWTRLAGAIAHDLAPVEASRWCIAIHRLYPECCEEVRRMGCMDWECEVRLLLLHLS
jgi:hypothetical protein